MERPCYPRAECAEKSGGVTCCSELVLGGLVSRWCHGYWLGLLSVGGGVWITRYLYVGRLQSGRAVRGARIRVVGGRGGRRLGLLVVQGNEGQYARVREQSGA
jgi:hypothetical protein